MKRPVPLGFVSLALVVWLTVGCQVPLAERIKKVHPGDTRDQVIAALGQPSSIIEAASTTDLKGTVLMYGSGKDGYQVVLIDNKVFAVNPQ